MKGISIRAQFDEIREENSYYITESTNSTEKVLRNPSPNCEFRGGQNDTFSSFISKENPFGACGAGMFVIGGSNGSPNITIMSNGGMDGGTFVVNSGGGRRSNARQDPAVLHDLAVSLEDLLKGAMKKIKITRKVTSNNVSRREEKVLTIIIEPGWESGTKVVFPKEGDQHPNRTPADIVFIIKDKPHPKFKREGSDIKRVEKISLRSALTGVDLMVPTLDGPDFRLKLNTVVKPGMMMRFPGKGLPHSKSPSQRGDLIIEFDVEFPTQLISAQDLPKTL